MENTRNAKNRVNFFFLPTKKYIFTSVKAPIAHKNWSKEQYQKKFFKIKISFSSNFTDNERLASVNVAALFLLLNKKNFPIFETNLLFIKHYTLAFVFNDTVYFNTLR